MKQRQRLQTLLAVLLGSAIMITTGRAEAQAENYELFRMDVGVTGTYTPSFSRGGFGAVVEPKIMVHDQVAAGLRAEGAVMFGGSIDAAGDNVSMDVAAVAALLAKGEYFFTRGTMRPFASLGIGVYSIGSQSVSTEGGSANIDQKAGRFFGVAPGIGVDLGRVRLAATYNAILGADIEVRQTIGDAQDTSSFSQSFFTFELSFHFGGGPIRAPAPPAVAVAAPAARP